MHLTNKMPQHRFGNLEVRNNTIAQRADRYNIARCSAQHTLGVITDSDDLITTSFNRYDRRLSEHDAMVFNINECVGGSKVDTNIARTKPK